MRRIPRVLLPLLVSAMVFPVFAQEPPPEPPTAAPAIKAEARAVIVDVVVTDKQGRTVPGLRKEDFRLTEDGGQQTVSSFEEHQGVAPREIRLPPMPPNVFTNFPTTQSGDSANVLLLDLLNTQPQNQSFARQQLARYLGGVPPGTRLAVFALGSELRMVRGFTTDFSGLSAALDDKKLGVNPEVSRLRPTPAQIAGDNLTISQMRRSQAAPSAIAAVESFQNDQAAERLGSRTELTLEAFQQIARYLSGIPTRKNVIWFSDSFPISFFPDSRVKLPSNQEQVQKTSDMLTAAQVAIYPVSVLGVIGDPTFDAAGLAGTRQQLELLLSSNQIAMETIAEETGGRAYYTSNALDDAVKEALNNGSRYYTLAYPPANSKSDGKFRRIQVSVPDRDYRLSYRRGYYADKPRPEASADKAAEDPLIPLIGLGMPNFDQIIYKVQVAPKNPQPPGNAPRAGTNTELKPPFTRYDVEFAVALQDVAMGADPVGVRHGDIEVMLVAFDREGHIVNIVKKRSKLTMERKVYAATQQVGMQIREEIDVPPGEVYLRTGIYDLNSGKCGTVGAPLNVTAPAPPTRK